MSDEDCSSQASSQNKVEIWFKNTGNAPIMRKTKWNVSPSSTISSTIAFIRKYLKIEEKDSIFIYVNQSFAPALDQTIQNLLDCYKTDRQLVLYYSITQAWG